MKELELLVSILSSTLILLGDCLIQWFFTHFDTHYRSLSAFGNPPDAYGRLRAFEVRGHGVELLPFVYP